MSNDVIVRSALIKSVVQGGFFDPENIAWENREFTPTDQPWMAVWYLPSPNRVATLGVDGEDRHEGVLQLDLNYPVGEGEGAILEKYEEVESHYKAGARFADYTGSDVIIRACSRSPGSVVNGYYKISISITYYTNVSRMA